MTFDPKVFEQFRVFLPSYLNTNQARSLFSELSQFPDNLDYYWGHSQRKDELLQGDGWRGFLVRDFRTGEQKSVSGVVLSNSCDVAVGNLRNLPANILFAPLIALEAYRKRLLIVKSEAEVTDIVDNTVRQRVTNIFFLPRLGGVIEDSIVLLDDIHTHPLTDFLGRGPSALFKLKQHAWYLFLVKLSIHFTRLGESVPRFNVGA